MTGIIIFIILAIGYALCGDTSGIEAIGKGILYIALFLIVVGIMLNDPPKMVHRSTVYFSVD